MMNLNMSIILSVKITRHRIFCISSFLTIIPSIYTDEIFSLVFIDGYCEAIFN